MPAKSIPIEVKHEVQRIVDLFNTQVLGARGMAYGVRFRGRHLYLDLDEGGGPGPICRLEYTGHMNRWGFAIYKYSSDKYDPEEWWFPGAERVDGTIEGAMRAGLEAYT